jgi:hypothetical protein
MSNEGDFLEHYFGVVRVNRKASTEKRFRYLYVVYFKSDNDSDHVNRAVIIDKDCNVQTLSFEEGMIMANWRIRELSCIRVMHDEEEGIVVDVEQFHKGLMMKNTFKYQGDISSLLDTANIRHFVDGLIEYPFNQK